MLLTATVTTTAIAGVTMGTVDDCMAASMPGGGATGRPDPQSSREEGGTLNDYDEDGSCTWCDGGGWDECDDPIQCLDPKCDGEIHPCTACAGTGLLEHQVIW